MSIGTSRAFVLGNVAASSTPSRPKTWVAIVDVVAGMVLLVWVAALLRKPFDPKKEQSMIDQIGKLASSPAIAIVGAGAALANPGGFIPLALKAISETDPSASQYCVEWLVFTLVSLLPLEIALISLVVAREWTERLLNGAKSWLERHAMDVFGVIVLLAGRGAAAERHLWATKLGRVCTAVRAAPASRPRDRGQRGRSRDGSAGEDLGGGGCSQVV